MLQRSRLRAVIQVIGGLSSVVIILGGVLAVAMLSERAPGVAGAASPRAAVAGGVTAPPTTEPGPPLGQDTVESGNPPAESIAPPTSIQPLATPTPRPTRTPKPVVDPRPEGTPHYHLAAGHLGETITNDEISIRVSRTTIPASFDLGLCARQDPAAEALAFEVTETWTHWTSVDWTLEMGGQPQVHWLEDPPDYGNGRSNVIVTCHWPGDSTRIEIYSGPLERTDVPEDYQWVIS